MDTNNTDNVSIPGRDADTPEVKPKHAGGRPRKDSYRTNTQAILNGSAPMAAQILDDHINGKRGMKTIKPTLQRACEYVIDHAIGKSRQKVEHSGGILTYGELAKSAAALDKKPRDILAEVEEIANKTGDKTPG